MLNGGRRHGREVDGKLALLPAHPCAGGCRRDDPPRRGRRHRTGDRAGAGADARLLLAAGRLRVDGATVRDGRHEIREFSRIELDDELLQAGKPARYFMLNKPAGVVSATEHAEHRTVLDLLDEFKRFLQSVPEVMQCYVVTGRADFAMMIAVRDIDHYEAFATRVFRQNPNIRHFETMVVMSRVKFGMSLPLDEARE